jgi:hypothetical protein
MFPITEVLETVKIAGHGLEKAAQLEAEVEAQRVKIASMVPTVVEEMLAAGLIEPAEKAAAVEAMSGHETTLRTLVNFCRTVRAAKLAGAPLGDPVPGLDPSPEAPESERRWRAGVQSLTER